jgi:hypothetical protein
MLKSIAFAAAIASVTLAASTLSAQSAAPTTLIGCVYQEKDVPGRAPNIAERAGLLEDYILAELSPAEAAKPTGTAGSAMPTTYSMYKLEKVADSQLKAMVGKRVEVTGTLDVKAKDSTGQPSASVETNKTDKIIGHDRIDLPEFEVSRMRAVEGSCPAKPTVVR